MGFDRMYSMTVTQKHDLNWFETDRQIWKHNKNWFETDRQIWKHNKNWFETDRQIWKHDKNWFDTDRQAQIACSLLIILGERERERVRLCWRGGAGRWVRWHWRGHCGAVPIWMAGVLGILRRLEHRLSHHCETVHNCIGKPLYSPC